jgi:pimeloyl-ACP methyl ester carboxylesterase
MTRNEILIVEGLPLNISFKEGSPDHPPLLLCNGIGMGLEVWGPLAEKFDRTTLAFDVPLSRHNVGWPLTLRRFARVIVGMLDQLDIPQVDVLGVSWGGTLAQELAHRYPDRVRHLVLAATGCGIPAPPPVLFRLFGLASSLLTCPESKRAYEIVAATLYGGDIVRQPHFLSWIEQNRTCTPLDYIYQVYALVGWTSMFWLHTLPHRTLVMGGDDDAFVPFVNSKVMASCIPNATLHTEEGGGHLFLLTRTDESHKVIDRFLNE